MSGRFTAELSSLRSALPTLSMRRFGIVAPIVLAAYFVFVVPNELSLLLVGGAAVMAAATYAPVLEVLGVTWLLE